MYNLVESIIIGASLLRPYLPETTEKILAQLNAKERDYEVLDQFGLYESGTKVTDQPEILFARQDLKEVMEKVEAVQAAARAAAGIEDTADEADDKEDIHVEPKAEITYDDFDKCQFVVGEVLACETVPKSKKLLKFQIKIGDQTRQILSGIRKWYPEPEKLIGMKVMALINLAPRQMCGLESQGMLLSAEDAEGNVCLMTPSRDVPSGSGIG
jgi:methionyl-tRNA synthetase